MTDTLNGPSNTAPLHDLVNEGEATIRIVGRRNGVGLDRDVELIKQALTGTSTCDHQHVRSLKPLLEAFWGGRRDDSVVNVFVERIPLTWMLARGKSILIPNQERFPRRHIGRLHGVDIVYCKSRHAEKVFGQLGIQARYIGFTSVDRNLADTNPDYRKFFHLAGRSTLKGTEVILSLWKQHPEWPTLTLIQHPDHAPKEVPGNVHLLADYVDDDTLRRLQNEHGIHLCPSLAEGWGHYIVEAMSCNAVVITTDAPPMNELVDRSRGILVPWADSTQRHLGTMFRIDDKRLEAAIQTTIDMPCAALEETGKAARDWFAQNDQEFTARINEAFEELRAA